ncbi:hypothetical protein N7462_009136 [Penicillium macrosclerotiorum]|uniref:uncharacterized protein n=1 Tax=Penicillium macrosclerotiorum TaxID=303699 RepID=UPI0025485EDD|nr:uncharacterized protein N7462_009136 [Penicillium macrosclerotiorum]KAJ5676239.1 hypothetical protein N7462_009136 [Penicillium macrosclerotiorum]
MEFSPDSRPSHGLDQQDDPVHTAELQRGYADLPRFLLILRVMTRIKPGVFSWEDVLAQRYQNHKPAPLPRAHRRALPASPQPQPQCRLLACLSPEVRLIVWEMVLGGLRLHIIQCNGPRLGHIVCPRNTDDTLNCKPSTGSLCEICHGAGIPQPVKRGDAVTMRRQQTGRMLLGLALSCRQIYTESIHLLYALPIFEFSNPWSLSYLRPTLPPGHWDSLHAIELRWSFSGHWLPTKDPVRAVYVSAGRAQWLDTCRALKRLPALRSFVLVLASSWFREPIEKLPVFLEPLRGLRVRPRRGGWASARGGLCSSDEESCSASSESDGSNGRRCSEDGWSCFCAESALTDPPPTFWELRLQGQLYYAQELGQVGEDLRRRGINCFITT